MEFEFLITFESWLKQKKTNVLQKIWSLSAPFHKVYLNNSKASQQFVCEVHTTYGYVYVRSHFYLRLSNYFQYTVLLNRFGHPKLSKIKKLRSEYSSRRALIFKNLYAFSLFIWLFSKWTIPSLVVILSKQPCEG